MIFVRTLVLALALSGPALAGALEMWRWERRVLLVFADAADTPALLAQRQRIAEEAAGFADRRLLLVTVIGDDARSAAGDRLDAADLRARFDVPAGFTALLIGLDGGEKARSSPEGFSMPELYSKIDRMPMRRRALEARGDG